MSAEDITQGLSAGVAASQIFPVLCLSGGQMLGIQPVLDAMVDLLPSPASRPSVTGTDPKTQEAVERSPDPSAPFTARVFKTVDSQAGKLALFHVLSGQVESDSVVYNATRDAKERLGQLFHLKGKKQEPVATALPGDIIGVAKLKETHTGDTLCDDKNPTLLAPLVEFNPAISFALGLRSRGDEEKIMTSLGPPQRGRLGPESGPGPTVQRDSYLRGRPTSY